MNEKTIHNDVIICYKRKDVLRCSLSQHSRNLFTVQKEDLGWILGKNLLAGWWETGHKLTREDTESPALWVLRMYYLKYLPGVGKGKNNPASKQTAVRVGVIYWPPFLQLPSLSSSFARLSRHPGYLQCLSIPTVFSRPPSLAASHFFRK